MKTIPRSAGETKLEKTVVRILNNHADGYDNISGVFDDLMQGGCQSGMIGELIYYSDTVKFYKKHQTEIDRLLFDIMQESANNPAELFGDKWDSEDPLARDVMNQNLLAWFGFEETARIIADKIGIEV